MRTCYLKKDVKVSWVKKVKSIYNYVGLIISVELNVLGRKRNLSLLEYKVWEGKG